MSSGLPGYEEWKYILGTEIIEAAEDICVEGQTLVIYLKSPERKDDFFAMRGDIVSVINEYAGWNIIRKIIIE